MPNSKKRYSGALMRNYFMVWRGFFVHQDPPNPDQFLSQTFATEEAAAAFSADSGGFWALSDPPEVMWILLNKTLLVDAINNSNVFNHLIVESSSPRYGIDGEYKEKKAPAGAWPSNDGNKNGPTFNKHLGDEKRFTLNLGVHNVITTGLTALELLYNALVAAGQLELARRLLVFITAIINDQTVDPVKFNSLLDTIDRVLA